MRHDGRDSGPLGLLSVTAMLVLVMAIAMTAPAVTLLAVALLVSSMSLVRGVGGGFRIRWWSTSIALALCAMHLLIWGAIGFEGLRGINETIISMATFLTGLAIVLFVAGEDTKGDSLLIVSAYLVSNLLLVLQILTLLLFDWITDHSMIVDNRWMMFIMFDLFMITTGIAVLALLLSSRLPFDSMGAVS